MRLISVTLPSFKKIEGATFVSNSYGFDANGFDEPMQIMDIDSDGYDELVGYFDYTPKVGTNPAYWNLAVFKPVFADGADLSDANSLDHKLSFVRDNRYTHRKGAGVTMQQFVDINGDGLPDNLYADYDADNPAKRLQDNRLYMQFNNGKGF